MMIPSSFHVLLMNWRIREKAFYARVDLIIMLFRWIRTVHCFSKCVGQSVWPIQKISYKHAHINTIAEAYINKIHFSARYGIMEIPKKWGGGRRLQKGNYRNVSFHADTCHSIVFVTSQHLWWLLWSKPHYRNNAYKN